VQPQAQIKTSSLQTLQISFASLLTLKQMMKKKILMQQQMKDGISVMVAHHIHLNQKQFVQMIK